MSSGAITFKRRLGSLQLISPELSNLHQNKLDGQTAKHVRGKICTFDWGVELSLSAGYYMSLLYFPLPDSSRLSIS